MNYSIIYTPEAVDDLRGIYSYIAMELLVPDTAKNQVNRIREAILNLDSFPKKHPEVDWEPWKGMGVRKFPVDNYIVFYLVDDEMLEVNIVRIFYGGMNIEEIINS